MSHTNKSVLERFNVSDLSLEFPEAEVAIETGNQRQGDVFVLRVTTTHAGEPLGKGVRVVASENSPNTHTLHGDGLWEWSPRAGAELVQGWLTVPAGGEAFLLHTEEHSAIGIGGGTYEIRRQREFAGEWRQVAD
jgi:hypothetical protein